jgi:O-glycosyl hydrolase
MMNKMKIGVAGISLAFVISLSSCDNGESPEPTPPDPDLKVTVDPTAMKQEMIGFGGALTWYSNWITAHNKKAEIADLMFEDLGIDIIRFKNWYYPDNYPTVKTTDAMSDDNSKASWAATNELYTLAKDRNPNVKVLFSSWGPPASLKNNASTREGTLKKDGSDVFMYDAYADYWVDVLDHVPFNPDYISIQNEPTYTNSGWTTCKWSHIETTSLPDYIKAFDMVYDKIKNRTYVPLMIGPESQDVPTFSPFANILKTKDHCYALAYHPYNINSGTGDGAITSLQSIGAFTTKPNIMTEFSDNLDWYSTAVFIHRAMVYANSSGYIYWKLGWATPATGTDAGMISVTSNAAGAYTVTPFYYLIKHFSKNIDHGYHRVEATSIRASLYTSAYLSPDGKKLTVIAINNGTVSESIDVEVTGKTITNLSAVQSKQDSYYTTLSNVGVDKAVPLAAKSITTIVIDLQ